MSKKSTKIIAAAGVVAGLGVAALPALTFAASSVTGTVDVIAEVESAIAMEIHGNNDDATGYGPSKAKNPGTITSLDTLDATALASFSDTTATVTSSSLASLLPNASVHGNNGENVDNGFYSTITVYTNDSGYNLGISALSALAQEGSGAPTIPATGIVKAGVSGWGYSKTVQTDAADAETANYQTAANTALTTGTGPTTGGDDTIVYYGVSTSPSQATGTYKSTVTYTATTAH